MFNELHQLMFQLKHAQGWQGEVTCNELRFRPNTEVRPNIFCRKVCLLSKSDVLLTNFAKKFEKNTFCDS